MIKIATMVKRLTGLMLGTSSFSGLCNLFNMAVKLFCSPCVLKEHDEIIVAAKHKENVNMKELKKQLSYNFFIRFLLTTSKN